MRGIGSMQCQDAQALMTAYLGDEVVPVERREFEGHLAACACCREELASFRESWERLGRWPVPAMDSRIERDFLARVEHEAATLGPRLRPVATALVAVAAVLLSIAASVFLPYERAFQLCREALRGFSAFAGLPDSAVFFVAGVLYGVIPLLLVALVSARLMGGAGALWHGTVTGVAFALLMTPYVLIVCSALPGVFTAAILGGIALGGLSGSAGGLWLGSRAWRPAW
jgi:anti-sigma factor RsiW